MQLQASVLLFAALVASAAAQNKIKCYSCTSETDPNCNDPLNTEAVQPKECTSDITNNILGGLNTGLKGIGSFLGLDRTPQIDANFACLKGAYTQTLEDGKEKKVVIRSCMLESAKVCDTLNEKSKEKGIKDVFCQECKSDGCNGSSSVKAAAFILMPVVAVLLASY